MRGCRFRVSVCVHGGQAPGRWIGALPPWGLSLDPALMVGRLSFLKKKKKGRKRVSAWWGGSVGFDVACGKGWEVRWLRTAPPYAL